MTTFANDTFTGADGTNVSAHTPDDGGAWTALDERLGVLSGTAATTALLASNQVRSSSAANGSNGYRHNGTPATAEYDVQADFIIGSNADLEDYWLLGARMDGTGTAINGSRYIAGYRGSTQIWRLAKIVSGVFTQLAIASAVLTGSHTCKFEVRNATKKIYGDGVQVVTSADNAISQVGKVGFTVARNTSSNRLDNFSAADPSASSVARSLGFDGGLSIPTAGAVAYGSVG